MLAANATENATPLRRPGDHRAEGPAVNGPPPGPGGRGGHRVANPRRRGRPPTGDEGPRWVAVAGHRSSPERRAGRLAMRRQAAARPGVRWPGTRPGPAWYRPRARGEFGAAPPGCVRCWPGDRARCGVKDAEQFPCRVPDVTATLTITRYPGVAPPMW